MLVAAVAEVEVLATTARVVGFAVAIAFAEVVEVVTSFGGVVVVVGVALLDEVLFGAKAAVVEVTTATFVLPVSMETEYAETEKMASVPKEEN